jgi:hypothetical protein
VVQDLLTGQYTNPIRVIAFNTAEGWSQDVSMDVAHECRDRCDLQGRDIPFFLQEFRRLLRRPLSRHPVAAADAPGLTVAFQRC